VSKLLEFDTRKNVLYRVDTKERSHLITAESDEKFRQAVVLHTIDGNSSLNVAAAPVSTEGRKTIDNREMETLDAQHSDGEDVLGEDDTEVHQTQYCAQLFSSEEVENTEAGSGRRR
jgi:hypothetical protein